VQYERIARAAGNAHINIDKKIYLIIYDLVIIK